MVKVVALTAPEGGPEDEATRRIGFLAGSISVPEDFDSMGSGETESLFQGTE